VLIEERARDGGDWNSAHDDLFWSLGTPAGRAYRYAEILALLRDAGFDEVETHWPPDPTCCVSGLKGSIDSGDAG